MTTPHRYTHDSISLRGAGIVSFLQPAKGHRLTLDSILLADFCRVKPNDRVLEPGAGTGIVSILLAKKHRRASFVTIEVQKPLVDLCERNIAENSLGDRFTVVAGDLRRPGKALARGSFDVIAANPPYIKEGTGRTSPDDGRRTSRQDRAAPIEAWLGLHRCLKQGGRYCMVFSAARTAELLALMRKRRLEPKRLRFVHPRREAPASLVLVESVKDGGCGLEVLEPLVVHEGRGYSEELRDIYSI